PCRLRSATSPTGREKVYMLRRGARARLFPRVSPTPSTPLLSRQDVLGRDLLRGLRVGPRLGYEHGLAVVAQLRDGLPDVGEGAVVAVLLRAVEVRPRVPAAG